LSVLYKTLKIYFDKYPDKAASIDEFSSFFFGHYPKLKKEEIDGYQTLFQHIKESEVSTEQASGLLIQIEARAKAVSVAEAALKFTEGKISADDYQQLIKESLSKDDDTSRETTFVTDDLEEILGSTYLKSGLRWRLNSLNRSLGSLRKGDFGFVFARPETGKTTFLASEVTHFAAQAEGPILWFNNEEQGSKVKLRCYQAALGVPREYLISNQKKAYEQYRDITGSNIKIVDSGVLFKGEVEKTINSIGNPSLIIFDQIDKIRGFDADRNDLVMGSIYQWARELAKAYCPVIGVCQADGSGDGVRWLTMSNVAEAKTAKQGEADWILGIGKTYDPSLENVRHFHLSKNKLTGDKDSDPAWRHGKWDVLIQPEIARYKDLGAK
jgi:replicative DNA helicase